MNNWFSEAFGDFADMKLVPLLLVIAAVAAGIGWYVWYARTHRGRDGHLTGSQWTTKELTTAALCIGLSFLLSFIKLFSMPNGGSITPASMLPLLAFSYMYGVRKGILAGLVYGLLQFVQEPFVLTPLQVLLDYPLAFACLGFAGFARRSIVPGIIYGCAGRFVCQFLSGWLFFGEYAPEGVPAWLYSAGYSGSVCGIECALCIAVSLIPALSKMLSQQRALARSRREHQHAVS